MLSVCIIIIPYLFSTNSVANLIFFLQLGGKVKQMLGKVGEAICEAAKEENATMIIVGTRGMGKVRRTFLGSVSDYCLHHSNIPVLVCRHKDHADIHHHHHQK